MYSCLYAQKGTQIFRQYIDLTKSNFTNQNQFLLKIMQANKTMKHYVVVLNLIIVLAKAKLCALFPDKQ